MTLASGKANEAATGKLADWAKAKAAATDAAYTYSTYANLSATNDVILKDLALIRASADKEGAANNVARILPELDFPHFRLRGIESGRLGLASWWEFR